MVERMSGAERRILAQQGVRLLEPSRALSALEASMGQKVPYALVGQKPRRLPGGIRPYGGKWARGGD